MANVRQDNVQVNVEINGQKAGQTLKDLKKDVSSLYKEIQSLTPGTQEFINKSKEIQAAEKNLKSVKDQIKGIDTELKQATGGFQQFLQTLGPIGVALASIFAIGRIYDFVKESIIAFATFQKALSSLKAITGASAEDLKYYSAQAKEIGATTTLSATQAVEAFKLIGSAKPELLKNKEALAAVTKEAIALAEAAEMDLPTAAKATAEALNQFGEGADQASRYVNVMAAGAKEGAAEISEVAASMKNSGTVAAAANVSFEQTNAVIQSLSTIAIKGGEAGTGLRNVLLKLMAGADDTNPKVVGLEKALDNLGKKNLSTAELTKLFGSENVVVAQHMVDSRDKILDLTKAITGTQEAYIQQAANTDNLVSDYKAWESATESVQIALGEKLEPTLRMIVKTATQLLLGLKDLPKFLYENRDLFLAFGIALVTFNTAQIAATAGAIAHAAAERARAIATHATTIAQNLLNAAMTANPIGLIIKGVALLAAAFLVLYNRSEMVRGGIAGLWEWIKVIAEDIFKVFQALNPANIAKMLMSGDFSQAKDAFSNFGKGAGDAFTKGYNDKIASEKDGQIETAAAIEAEKQEAEKKEIEKGHTKKAELTKAQLAAAKKAADEKLKIEQDRIKAELDAEKKLEDIRIQMIADDVIRKQQQLVLAAEREIESIRNSQATAEQKSEMVKLLETKLQQDLSDIQAAADKERLEKAAEQAAKEREIKNRAAVAQADLEIMQATGNDRKLLSAVMAKLDTQKAIELQNTDLLESEKALITAKYEAEKDKVKEDFANKEHERQRKIAESGVQLLTGGLQALSDFEDLKFTKEENQAETLKNSKLKKLDAELKAKVISQDQYESAKAGIESEYDKKSKSIKKRQAEQDKQTGILQATIATIVAVAKALPNIPLSILAGITGGLQVAKIASTKVPEYGLGGLFGMAKVVEYAAGGLFNTAGGIPKGSLHSEGGISMIDSRTGAKVGEMERDEPYMILSRATYSNNKEVIDQLLDSSMYNGGRSIKYADGGTTGPLPSTGSGGNDAGQQLLSKMDQLIAVTAAQKTALKAFIVYQELKDTDDLMNQIDDDSSFG